MKDYCKNRNQIEGKLDELLREEFKKRNFYLLYDELTEFAPMPYGFKDRKKAAEYLIMEKNDYDYLAYKNMLVAIGIGVNIVTVGACIFIKIGSQRYEPHPIIELTAFYDERMYRFVCRSLRFSNGMLNTRRYGDDIKNAVKMLMDDVAYVIDKWYRSIRTLIIENRWPEEEYISMVN